MNRMMASAVGLGIVLAGSLPAGAQQVRAHGDDFEFADDETVPPLPGPIYPPYAIADLAVTSMTETSVSLAWTSPDDPDAAGVQAKQYDLRFSTQDPAGYDSEYFWFDEATPVAGEPLPSAVGSIDAMKVADLSTGVTYYFAIRSNDGHTYWSGISNIVSIVPKAPPPPDASVATPTGSGSASGGDADAGCGQSAAGSAGMALVLAALLAAGGRR